MIKFARIFGGVLMDVISLFLEQRLEIFLEINKSNIPKF